MSVSTDTWEEWDDEQSGEEMVELPYRVFANGEWMREEVRRRFQPWLERQAKKMSGKRVGIAEQLVERTLARLAAVDVTRFDERDLDELRKQLKAELRRWRRELGGRRP